MEGETLRDNNFNREIKMLRVNWSVHNTFQYDEILSHFSWKFYNENFGYEFWTIKSL